MKRQLRQDKNQLLHELEELGRSGRYREAIRYYLTNHTLPPTPKSTTTDAQILLQYAISLQHAGLFDMALKVYRQVTSEIAGAVVVQQKDDISLADIKYNAKVQEAVLLERLGQPSAAVAILEEIGPSSSHGDARIARASLNSWVDITKLKCALALSAKKDIQVVADQCVRLGDWNQKLWGRLFLALLPLVGLKNYKKFAIDRIVGEVNEIICEMETLDPPGAPWLALIAGQEIARHWPGIAKDFIELAHQKATILGKFFIIAAASEQLSVSCLRGKRNDESSRFIRRAMNAYARCGLLMLDPFKSRLFTIANRLWSKDEAVNIFLRSAQLLHERESLVFSQMCKFHAQHQQCRPDEIFEKFTRDWALSRYGGSYRHIEKDRETVDVLIEHTNGSIAIQAKHVAEPKKHIPKQLYLRNLATIYNTSIKCYVFVVTTSALTGWNESLWHANYTERVQQLVPDTEIRVEIVLEPELQTDVTLNEELFGKYFRDVGAP